MLAAAAKLQEKMAAIDEQYRQLMNKIAEADAQRQELDRTLARVRDPENYRGGAAPAGTAEEVGAQQKAEKEEAESKPPEIPRVSWDVGGVLTPKGRLVIEPSFQYVYSSFNTVAVDGVTIPGLLIGVINIEDASRDTYIPSIAARYGVTSRMEVEARLPYVIRSDSTRTRRFLDTNPADPEINLITEDRFFNTRGNDFGDLEFGIRYQFPRIGPDWPFLTGNIGVKSNTGSDPYELFLSAFREGKPITASELATGSGFWSISPSITFLYPSDPVVFFGNIGYLWTLEDNKGSATGPQPADPTQPPPVLVYDTVNPGDAIRFSVGMGFGLNDRASFSLGYSLDIYSKTTVSGFQSPTLNGSDFTVGKLTIGYSLKLGNGQPFNLAIGIGATADAPDTDVSFRMPFNFLK
ncbi:MAG: transporter [Gammaproteobacteria bacterium]